jgi:hypothetical protein
MIGWPFSFLREAPFGDIVVPTLFILAMEWLSAIVGSLFPYCVAIIVARQFSFLQWWYFAGGGLLTSALLCIFHADSAREGPPLGPVPDPIPSLMQTYVHFAPYFWVSGTIAGLVCWYILRKERTPP